MNISVVGGGPGGLYAALLLKKEWPDWQVAVYERNAPDATFGFGVVFSDETLGIFRDYDRPSYEAIRRAFAYWDDVEIHFKGDCFRIAGNGFAGCSRLALLTLLYARCRELGVALHFGAALELDDPRLAGSDLIIAADGINSRIREGLRDHFGTTVTLHQNHFCWLGSTREFDAFEYFFKETPHGPLVAHCYQYEPQRSTWVIEVPDATWRGLGFDRLDDAAGEHLPLLAEHFAEELVGHPLLDNRSLWRRFPTIRNRTWVRDNLVLLGDAKASAHFSIGSGTKLAMEDAIALFESLRRQPTLAAALHDYDTTRREEVEKTQHAAEVSLHWFEALERHWSLDPEQFAFGVMSRSKQITYENLQLRDPAFVRAVERWFLDEVRAQGFSVRDGTVPMFTPFRLRELVLPNRVVVSPMAQYAATDGLPNDWHLVHLGSRATGGAGLILTEMTCPSPEARITPGCTGLWNEEQAEAWRRIVEFVHANSASRIGIQLGHAGRKGSTQRGWEEENHPLPEGNWPLVSASPLPYDPAYSQTPAELDEAGMAAIIASFVRATHYAAAVGFDLLELHMAHGYLLASFISPLTNQRTDGYGGPIERRMRFPLALFEAVRAAWPAERPISVRLSATDWADGGLSDEELLAAAAMLKAAGADLIDVSTGQTVAWQSPTYGRMYQTPFADAIRHGVGLPTMAVGAVTTPDQVNTILLQGRADLVALARPHLTAPSFTNEAAAWYDERGHYWPPNYWPGRNQAYRLAEREREEWRRMRAALKPPTHEVGRIAELPQDG